MGLISQIIISTFTALISASMIIILVIYGKKVELTNKFIIVMIMCFIYATGQIIESILVINITLLGDNNKLNWLYYTQYYKFIAVFYSQPVWLMFFFAFSQKSLYKFELFLKKYAWIFFIPGIVSNILLTTNSWSEMIFSVRQMNGVWIIYLSKIFKLDILIYLLFNVYGLIIVLRHVLKKYKYYRKQSVIILFLAFIPGFVGSIYTQTSLYQRTNNFDLTPTMILLNILIYIVFIKYRFINLFHIPVPKMMDTFKESIMFIDAEGIIVYINKSLEANFKYCKGLKLDHDANCFIEFIREQHFLKPNKSAFIHALKGNYTENVSSEIIIDTIGKHYSVNIQPLYDKNDFIGDIVTFYDVTDYRKLLSEVEDKNKKLSQANIKLKEYAETSRELAVTKERNRLAGEIHDSAGHTMTILISLLGVCSLALEKGDRDMVKLKLNEMTKAALEGHRELRNSVQGIVPMNQGAIDIKQSIMLLARDFEITGVKVNITVDGQEMLHNKGLSEAVRKICREALTNSIRHGKSSKVDIILRFSEKNVELYIFDNGVGCKKIERNMGLSSMEAQVMELGGKITFGSDGENGFNIHSDIPFSK